MIQSDKPFELINENHIFEKMQLTDFNDDDLKKHLNSSQNLNTAQVRKTILDIKEKVKMQKSELNQSKNK